jgi:hypothetical protein
MFFMPKAGEKQIFKHYDHFRALASKVNAKEVSIDNGKVVIKAEEGELHISFPSRRAAHTALANWRCLEGVDLFVNGRKAGRVGRNNSELI